MERSWWWKAALYGFVTVVAVLYLIPTVVPDDKQPAFIQKHFQKRIQLGLDLQGGLHLVYEVNVDKAVAGKVDRLASDIEDRLHKDKGTNDLVVSREGRDDIVFTFKPPSDETKLDDAVLKDYRKTLDIVSRDAATGVVRLRLDPDQVEEVRDYALRQGIETIRGRVDKFGVSEPTIIKKGTDIIVELPGLKSADFERIKSIIGRTAQLEFKIVDDGSEYMKKVAASVPKNAGIDVVPESWTEKDTSKPHEDVTLRSKSRDTLMKFFDGLTGELALPPDHEIGYEETQGRNENGEATPDRYWRTYYMHKRAPLTGEYLSNADQTWDQQTGRPEVSFEFDRQGAAISERMTGDNIGRKMAILLDDKINSAPVIEGRIGARGRITLGGFGDPFALQQEAKDLVAVLRSGALPAPLKQDLRDAGRPDDGARRGPEGQDLDVHRRGGRHRVHAHLLPAVGDHRHRRHDPEHALHDRHPGRLRGVADAARDRRPGVDHRHGGRREHHHLRAHPRRAAPGQVGAHGGRHRASPAPSGPCSTRT